MHEFDVACEAGLHIGVCVQGNRVAGFVGEENAADRDIEVGELTVRSAGKQDNDLGWAGMGRDLHTGGVAAGEEGREAEHGAKSLEDCRKADGWTHRAPRNEQDGE